jgi:predicted esterase YcpF (UPF0227 family)
MRKKVLYLHGLESESGGDKVDFLKKKHELNVFAPSINYKDESYFEKLVYSLKSFEPDLIIGSSMGGFVAEKLSYIFEDADLLLLNPSIKHIKEMTLDPINLSQKTIILGGSDDVVNPIDTHLYFSHFSNIWDECEIEVLEGIGHRMPLNIFINIYNKYFQYYYD